METNKHTYQLQKRYEEAFGKRGIHTKAVEDLKENTPGLPQLIHQAVHLIEQWIDKDHWSAKNERLQHLLYLDLEELVYDLTALICLECSEKPMKLVAIASMCAKHLNMNNKIDSIHTVAEIIGLLGGIDLWDTFVDKEKTRWVKSRYSLDESVIRFKFEAMYLPPMIIKPRTLRHNRDSGYITQRGESLILSHYENHHDDDICLDVLNILNANEYSLDIDVLSSRNDKWVKQELTDSEFNKLNHEQKLEYSLSKEQWSLFLEQSYKLKTMMLFHGNTFYFQHKVDKRGRIYTSGYHISPQGTSFKKALINLKKKEICSGINEW